MPALKRVEGESAASEGSGGVRSKREVSVRFWFFEGRFWGDSEERKRVISVVFVFGAGRLKTGEQGEGGAGGEAEVVLPDESPILNEELVLAIRQA